jgi:hypothetical protein
MNTFREAIQMVITTNQRLLDNTIDIKAANQIAINTQTIINAAKVQIEIMKLTKSDTCDFFSEVKQLESIDATLKEIEERRKAPYVKSKRIEDIIDNAHK